MNYLEEPLKSLFRNIEYSQGYLNHLYNDLNKYEEIITQQINEKKKFLKGTRLVISDLTGETDNNWEINYYVQTEGYFVDSENYKLRNQEIYNVVALNLIAQSYETIERFLKEILKEYFKNNEQIAAETIGRVNFILNRRNVDWNSTINKLDQGVNNKGLLKIIRTLSNDFAGIEINNLENVNLVEWLEMISIVRHSIVHSSSIIKNNQMNKLTGQMKNYLERYFEIQEGESGSLILRTIPTKQTKLFKFICEYAFQIFKSLSISLDLEWKVLFNMK